MPISLTNDMMRQIIMDHYSNPQNKHQPSKEGFEKVHMHSDNCIDDLDIFLQVENGIVVDACFDENCKGQATAYYEEVAREKYRLVHDNEILFVLE